MPRRRNAPKPKKVSYELIPRDEGLFSGPMYALLDELVEKHHSDLMNAKIALAWCTSWKADADGRVTLGKCVKASDLQRQLAEFDFVILLSRFFWKNPTTTEIQRRALLDHELSHARPKMGPDGEQLEDETGRLVWRMRKHDLEEFIDVVKRNGCYLHDIESFAAAALRDPLPEFVPCETCANDAPGWMRFTDEWNRPRVKRCACWKAWRERCDDINVGKAEFDGAPPPDDAGESAADLPPLATDTSADDAAAPA